eukprot:1532180-Rhodomonas_salina.1
MGVGRGSKEGERNGRFVPGHEGTRLGQYRRGTARLYRHGCVCRTVEQVCSDRSRTVRAQYERFVPGRLGQYGMFVPGRLGQYGMFVLGRLGQYGSFVPDHAGDIAEAAFVQRL